MEAMSMGLKILTGHTCELADVSELDLNLSYRDPDFTAIIRKFLLNLTHVNDIIHLPQGLCMDGQDVIGVGAVCDRDIQGFSAVEKDKYVGMFQIKDLQEDRTSK